MTRAHTGVARRLSAAQIFDEHLTDCYTVAVRMLVRQEAAEEAVERAVCFAEHDLQRNGPPPAPRKWALLHVANACLLLARRTQSRLPTGKQVSSPWPSTIGTVQPELRPLFNTGLSFLSPDVRATVILHDFAGLFVADISELMGLDESQLRALLHGGRLFLRDYLIMSLGVTARPDMD
jgi:DNA-directed RNA polymerase specialized sigma24 family protein